MVIYISSTRSLACSRRRDSARRKAMLSLWRRNKFSASSRLRDLNRSATNIPSARRITNIVLNDAMILSYDTNPGWMEFSEGTRQLSIAFRENSGRAYVRPQFSSSASNCEGCPHGECHKVAVCYLKSCSHVRG